MNVSIKSGNFATHKITSASISTNSKILYANLIKIVKHKVNSSFFNIKPVQKSARLLSSDDLKKLYNLTKV